MGPEGVPSFDGEEGNCTSSSPSVQCSKEKPFQGEQWYQVGNPIAPEDERYIDEHYTIEFIAICYRKVQKTHSECIYLQTSPLRTSPPDGINIINANYRDKLPLQH